MKTAWKLCLALALMVAALLVVSIPVFAAETHTISGEYSVEGGSTAGVRFKLYHVGGFSRDEAGKPVLVLDQAIKSNVPADITIDLSIQKDDYETEDLWKQAWLDQAALVAKYMPDSIAQVGEDAVTDADGKFSFPASVENGLYLVLSKSDPIISYTTDDKGFSWTPQPMLVLVLDGDVKITIKPISEPLVKNVTVYKTWEDTGHETLRPDSIQVQLTYNGEDEGDPVTLQKDDSGVLKYEWKNLEKVRGVYDVREIMSDEMMANYTVSYTSNEEGVTKTINITNKYDRYKLVLLKKMPAFIANGDQATTTFVFEVKGYESADSESPIYTNRVGVQVQPGETQKEINVPGIPRSVKHITVKEIYAGGYKPDSTEAKPASFTASDKEGGIYSVEFANDFDVPYYSGGVINRFTRKFGEDNKPVYEWEAIGSVFKSED